MLDLMDNSGSEDVMDIGEEEDEFVFNTDFVP